MASAIRKTDDDYDTALKRTMQDCLPPILVEIIDRRPPDPIMYLAHALYKYREQQNGDMGSQSHGAEQSHDICTLPEENYSNNTGTNSNHRPGKMVQNTLHTMLVQDNIGDEGLSEMTEELDHFISRNDMVHKSEEVMMAAIGDLFDDGDVS